MGVSISAIRATWVTVPVWCAFVLVYLTLRLLLPELASRFDRTLHAVRFGL